MRTLPLVLLLSAGTAWANDGRNRYEGMVPSTLHHLNGPVSSEAGFRVLPGDMEGGADGDPAFRWAQRHAIALVRLSTHRVATTLGAGPYPLAVFDLSAENGDTPVALEDGVPRGRHPGGSHDGGQNLDLGYYLTSEKGLKDSPDPAACTDHYSGEKDENKCVGPADRLDTERQTLFLVELVRTHLDRFDGDLLETIGIDAVVRKAVVGKARAWAGRRTHGVTPKIVDEMERLFASSPYEGWARFHLHHVHVRFQIVDEGGRHGRALAALIDEDRRLEAQLLDRAGGDAVARHVSLGAELASSALERELDLQLLGDAKALAAVKAVRFRTGGGDWETPADPLAPLHHVVDVEPSLASGSLVAEAELEFADGAKQVIRRGVALPHQPAWLHVRVDANRFTGRARAEHGDLELWLDFPPVYTALITKVELVVTRTSGAPERLPLPGPAWSARVKETGVALVKADVTLSGRMHLSIPVYVAAPEKKAE